MPSQVSMFSPKSQDFHHGSDRSPVEMKNSTKLISLSKSNLKLHNSLNPFIGMDEIKDNNMSSNHRIIKNHSNKQFVSLSSFRNSMAMAGGLGSEKNNLDSKNSSGVEQSKVLTAMSKVNNTKDISVVGEDYSHSNHSNNWNSHNTNSTNSSSNNKVPGHVCDIYCIECEIAAKKSRTLLLSTGGDVIINSSIENFSTGNCTNWMESSSSSCCSGGHRVGGGSNSGHELSTTGNNPSNFSVKLNVPNVDFRTQRLVININIENKKKISDEYAIKARNLSQLKESGWYYESMNYLDAQNLLAKSETGTFLLRNSSDSRFHFSLSVQTDRGPTSIRINFIHGKFQFDADKKFSDVLPKVETVVGLVEHHLRTAQSTGQVWVEPSGKRYSQVVLTKPLKKNVPTLQHLCRIALNNSAASSNSSSHPPQQQHILSSSKSSSSSINSNSSFTTNTSTSSNPFSSSNSSSRDISNNSQSHHHQRSEQEPTIPPGIQKYLSEYPYRL